jgi:hypothetical protein
MDCLFDDADDNDVPILQILLDDDDATTDIETKQPETAVAAAAAIAPIVPVMILTGFLGSVKSILIKHVLNSSTHGRKIAVIENEFGGGSNSRSGGNYESDAAINVESVIIRDGTTIMTDDDNDFVTEETELLSTKNQFVDLVELPMDVSIDECCGKSICKGCIHSFSVSGNIGKCPFCNSERAGKTSNE